MTTFRTQILTCNHCEHRMFTYELGSYHVHSSEVYTDGYIDYNPPISFNPHVLICSNCLMPMWREDVKFEDMDNNISEDELDQSKDVFDLELSKLNYDYNIAKYYSELIKDGFANTVSREITLRMEIWHLLNNNYRFAHPNILTLVIHGNFKRAVHLYKNLNQNKLEDRLTADLFKKNIIRLIDIFKPEDEEEKLLLAEMYRENRNYQKSRVLLKEIKHLTKTRAYRVINSAAKRRKSRVIKVN
ncbi:MAG: hypothetical protein HQ521_00870 [Bacteroidetes bacterium]|nr:hypothetical protein [Bacteroidota bacterium]